MICNLIQHSKWNRKHHPFLLCKYEQGDVVKDVINYKCNLISDTKYKLYYEKVKKRFINEFREDYAEGNMEKH